MMEYMSMTAVASYLRALREGRAMSRARLAALLDTSEVTIWRIEHAHQEPSGSLLVGFVRAVRGSTEQVADLMLDKEATEEDGRQLAHSYLSEADKAAMGVERDPIPGEHVEAALTVIRDLLNQRRSQT
jgi:transcriptional regulator with XRE-family HTH domain